MSPLIQASELAKQLGQPDWVVVDCRHDLTQPDAGRLAYEQGHLPGAVFAHLEHDLSGPKTGRNGRHPLPDPAQLAETMAALGISKDCHVVAYDAHGGMFAARLWWLLSWLGFESVQVLNGGVTAWLAIDGKLDATLPNRSAIAPFEAKPQNAKWVDAEAVMDNLDRQAFVLIDARAPGRFAGEGETMDPAAGHIPGAVNHFYQLNLQADGRFKPADVLRSEWHAFLDGRNVHDTVQQCGSGVTACHNLLALEVAGMSGSRLYPGSWSEWCTDPNRPIARGAAN